MMGKLKLKVPLAKGLHFGLNLKGDNKPYASIGAFYLGRKYRQSLCYEKKLCKWKIFLEKAKAAA